MELHRDNNGVITSHISTENPGHNYEICHDDGFVSIDFQNGPVKENGVNGITSEALLSILIHRTEVLNSNFPCAENEAAIAGLKAALEAFESRTRDRIARQVEGENKV
ncbi:hypothetical protein LVJ82_00745 [Vitreoscilla massiliensis]|uniref:Acb2/Tad1 hairpin domain-containing protein n=1 Tax=Vitreoscilla massiliensis TaxID=1689272 RepID=A0ABY4E177_9NEIS|nr:hypothetical protein [Vitreoscilla massiliensis]UOO89543.1 hypothetical protein LVJ82_00745 [Vitreoscilla massiliensis]